MRLVVLFGLLFSLVSAKAFEPVDGYWNDVNVTSTGYLVEAQNNNLVIYMFTWDEDSATTDNHWYVLQGRVDELPTMTLYDFEDKDNRQVLGTATVNFTDRENATITWPTGFEGHPNASAELQTYWFVGNNPRALSFTESKRIAWAGTWMVSGYFAAGDTETHVIELYDPLTNADFYADKASNVLYGVTNDGSGSVVVTFEGETALVLIQFSDYRLWLTLNSGKKSGIGLAAITNTSTTATTDSFNGLSSAVQYRAINKDTGAYIDR